jgi:diaminohydroxyphosphoribosylaminopyrimidine deaminase / 5-amino-6-(5-phosphoribosylamino)uracil reductase
LSLPALDQLRLQEALALAETSFGLTEPNPRVGCVLGFNDGQVIGRGATQAAGSHHAEVMALRQAGAAGLSAQGATAWVSLEPCAHVGRTPPCCDALIAAGIARCVVALRDPFPAVAGAGLARMQAAGIQVQVLDAQDPLAQQAREINIGFFSRIERGRPWLRVKLAASADGRVALANGQSKWITGAAARADGHAWRRRASAVLTGIGTVLADDPRLDVRAVPTAHQPLRIVLDTHLRMPANAAILRPPGAVLVVAGAGAAATAASALRAQGAEVWNDWPQDGPPDLAELLVRLAGRGLNELHVEAGPTLVGALAQAGLVDEWLLYMAPMLLGPGQPLAQLPALGQVADATRHVWTHAELLGGDLRLRMRR